MSVLKQYRTPDLKSEGDGTLAVGTAGMGEKVVQAI
jgi:hypothetical protein